MKYPIAGKVLKDNGDLYLTVYTEEDQVVFQFANMAPIQVRFDIKAAGQLAEILSEIDNSRQSVDN